MKVYKIELLTKDDFYKFEKLDERFYFYDVMLVVANTNEIKIRDLERWLSKSEIKSSKSYVSEIAKINFVISRVIVNIVFKEILKTDIENLNFQRESNNKPFIENPQGIKFNISHTDGCVIAGFSKREIGVDVEKINKRFSFQDILKECFVEKEINLIRNKHTLFFKYWTAKEAYLKWEGSGLLRNPKEIEILYVNESFIKIRDKNMKKAKTLKPIKLSKNYVGALCISEEI